MELGGGQQNLGLGSVYEKSGTEVDYRGVCVCVYE